MLKARLGPWLAKAYQVTTNIQEKLTGLQQTQQKIKLVTEGPTIEKFVEEVKQAMCRALLKLQLYRWNWWIFAARSPCQPSV